jgi:O-antigen biosynthesis protein
VDAVEQAAIHYPDWKFLLIGRVEDERVRRLEALPNVIFQGEVAHSELHTYLERFQVALIPFIRNELTMGTNPIKLYEYFSYGLPVIASRLPELEQFGDLVYLSESPAGFVEQLGKASTETAAGTNTDPRRIRRRQVANQETWTARVEQLSATFETLTAASS